MSGDLYPVDLEEMIHELKRELQLRVQLYPVRVRDKKLNARRAERQITIIEALIAKLEGERDGDRRRPVDQ